MRKTKKDGCTVQTPCQLVMYGGPCCWSRGTKSEASEWFRQHPEDLFYGACKTGHVECICYAYLYGAPLCRDDLHDGYIVAAENGRLDSIRIVHSLIPVDPPDREQLVRVAAEGGHLETLRWLVENGCTVNEWTCEAAAKGGHLNVLKWLRAPLFPCPWNLNTCEAAAENGHLECLQYATGQGADDVPSKSPYSSLAEKAARGGHLETLQWLRGNGYPVDELTCEAAAKGGHLNVLKWLRAPLFPCPWDLRTCNAAAWYGHFECLQYAHTRGCEWVIGLGLEPHHYFPSDSHVRHEYEPEQYGHFRHLQLWVTHAISVNAEDTQCGGEPFYKKDFIDKAHVRIVRKLLWPRVRAMARAASLVHYWQGETQRHLCAPGGAGRAEDLAAWREDTLMDGICSQRTK